MQYNIANLSPFKYVYEQIAHSKLPSDKFGLNLNSVSIKFN